MVRGHNNKRPATSAVKAEARRNPAPSMRPKAKASLIVDDRPSQWKKGRAKAPEWLESKRTKHEKIPGTRIQCAKGGWPVRVVLADGKEFPVDKVTLVKKHLKKLAQQEQEQRDVDSIINGDVPGAAAKAEAPGGATAAVAAAAARKAKRKAKAEAEAEAKGSDKKARKEEAWKQRQQKLVELHKASVERDGRQLLSDQWHFGEVVQRTSGRAWVKLRSPEQLPAELLEKLRAASEAARFEFSFSGDVLPVLFGDVAEQGLSLQPGAAVQFRVYTDRNGAGGCEVSSIEGSSKPPADEQPAKGKASAKRRRKAEPPKTEGAPSHEGAVVEAAEKAEPATAPSVPAPEAAPVEVIEQAETATAPSAPAPEAAPVQAIEQAEPATAPSAPAPEAAPAEAVEQAEPATAPSAPAPESAPAEATNQAEPPKEEGAPVDGVAVAAAADSAEPPEG